MDGHDSTFMDFVRSESFVSDGEREFEAWVKSVEALIGHSLDGDQDRDGYSIDFAHDAFADGLTPSEYAQDISGFHHSERRDADRVDGYDRDDIGESPDF